tara:strand:- start:15151 stop:15906 length:756 start_codon:yes stop_codon:yes gene_type:complete
MTSHIKGIVNWIQEKAEKAKRPVLVVGVSGGIDSAVVSTLCSKTKLKTIVVNMPIHQDPEQIDRATYHFKWLKENFTKVEGLTIDLTNVYDEFIKNFPKGYKYNLACANSRARLRMTTLYQIAGSSQGLVVGTGNKVEDFGVGFFTKYGDGGVDISPIADFMKSEVYEIGKELGIIDSILQAPPTDGLWGDGRTDEDQLGVTYDELEWAMQNGDCEMDEWDDRKKEVYDIFMDFNERNQHKMEPIPIYEKK